jgi:hypothetical protein
MPFMLGQRLKLVDNSFTTDKLTQNLLVYLRKTGPYSGIPNQIRKKDKLEQQMPVCFYY